MADRATVSCNLAEGHEGHCENAVGEDVAGLAERLHRQNEELRAALIAIRYGKADPVKAAARALGLTSPTPKVRVTKRVESDAPFADGTWPRLVAEPGIYSAVVNAQGAVAIKIDGKALGVRPGEFTWDLGDEPKAAP
jgi:hypothetical protein